MRSSRIVLMCVVVAVLAVSATGCSRAATSTKGAVLEPAQRSQAATDGSVASTDSAATKNAAAGSSGDTGAGGTVGNPGTISRGNGPVPLPRQTTVAGMKVLVIFWNDASSKRLTSPEVVVGTSSFKPDSGAKTSRGTVGPLAYGKKIDLIIYPDGRGGKKIVVPVVVSNQMVAKSELDAIHVAISDGTVRVLGNAVINLDQSYPRF